MKVRHLSIDGLTLDRLRVSLGPVLADGAFLARTVTSKGLYGSSASNSAGASS